MQPILEPPQEEPAARELNPWLAFRARSLLPESAPEPPSVPEPIVGDGCADDGNEVEVKKEEADDVNIIDVIKVVDVAAFVDVGEAAVVVFFRRPVGCTVKVIVVTISITCSSSPSSTALGFDMLLELVVVPSNSVDFAASSVARVLGGGSRLTKSKSWSGMLAVVRTGRTLDSSPDSGVKVPEISPTIVVIVYTTVEGWLKISISRRTSIFPCLFGGLIIV